MLFDPATTTHLKPWLVRTLEPICDAEPGALADYILALLKHNAPEADLRKELVTQLEEFLEKECNPFIDTLFTALRTKSYLPYSEPPPPPTNAPSSSQQSDQGIPIPLDAILPPPGPSPSGRTRKRSMELDDRDLRPAKGARLNDDGHYSRYGRQDGRWGNRGDRGSRMGIDGRPDYMDGGPAPGIELGMNGVPLGPRGSYRPPERRGVCRDYHNTGYCARGAFCKYSHGDDAIVPTQLFPMGPTMPFVPMLPNGAMPYAMQGGAYDPRERMDIRQPMSGNMMGRQPLSRPPVLPRHGDANGIPSHRPGELPVIQDLTPEVPSEERYASNQTGDSRPDLRLPPAQTNGGTNGVQTPPQSNGDVEMTPVPTPQNGRHPHPYRGGFRGGGSGGRGVFSDVASFRPERRDDKTLVVEKIPGDKLSLASVNEWFTKFGTVTNVAVDAANAKALVSFSNHDEAHAAWKSEDAVFGNRFVKVFWHRPLEGHGQKGARMLAASASLVANISSAKEAASTSQASTQLPTSATPSTSSHPKAPSAAVSALAAKHQVLEQQIAEQKSLMAKLSSASPQEKKEIMARLRKLNEEMKPPSASSTAPQTRQPSSSTTPATSSAPHPSDTVKKELLDKELDFHLAVKSEDTEESTEDLQAKLAKLKAEAASLGLNDAPETTPYGGGHSYRPYRGRARGGRGYYRGAMRGGPPRSNMSLDNRPKKLLIQGAGEGALQAVRDWYETTGQVESAQTLDGGDVLVSFKTRLAAEQGLAKGTNIATVGPTRVSWFTGQQPPPLKQESTSPAPDFSHPVKMEASSVDPSLHPEPSSSSGDFMQPTSSSEETHKMYDDEEEGHGWGGDDGEDGFGML